MLTATVSETQTASIIDPISAIDRSRIVHRMMKDHGMDEAYAAEVFEETVRFLEMCANNPGRGFAPSKEVDKGWHTFLLYTKAYRTFCKNVGAGRFIDHEPADLPGTQNPCIHDPWSKLEMASCDANDCTATDCYQGDDD